MSPLVIVPSLERLELDVFRFSGLVSSGTTGEEWPLQLERDGFEASQGAKGVLRSPRFQPTFGVEYEVIVIRGKALGNEQSDCSIANVRKAALSKGLHALTGGVNATHPEVACLIRRHFHDRILAAKGLSWIVVMHEPIPDEEGNPCLLFVDTFGRSGLLGVVDGNPKAVHGCLVNGFAFVSRVIVPALMPAVAAV